MDNQAVSETEAYQAIVKILDHLEYDEETLRELFRQGTAQPRLPLGAPYAQISGTARNSAIAYSNPSIISAATKE